MLYSLTGKPERTVWTIALVGIVRQIRIVRIKVIIEDTTAEAYTVNGEVWVGNRELGIGLVVVFGPVDTDRIASTQPVILLNTDLEADAAFSAVADTEVEATGVTLFNFINNVNLIRTTWYTLGISVSTVSKETQTVETLFTLIDEVASPAMRLPSGAFHGAERHL